MPPFLLTVYTERGSINAWFETEDMARETAVILAENVGAVDRMTLERRRDGRLGMKMLCEWGEE